MSVAQLEQQEVKDLVFKVSNGCEESFGRLEGIASPLIKSTAREYSKIHYKFEYEDFYALCVIGLYDACLSYKPTNPSFLLYAKLIMRRYCSRELEYWNQGKRNIFETEELPITFEQHGFEMNLIDEEVYKSNFNQLDNDVIYNEFHFEIIKIINDCFDSKKATVMKLYIVDDMKVSDISNLMEMKYKNTYSIVNRGMKRIEKEYKRRFLDK